MWLGGDTEKHSWGGMLYPAAAPGLRQCRAQLGHKYHKLLSLPLLKHLAERRMHALQLPHLFLWLRAFSAPNSSYCSCRCSQAVKHGRCWPQACLPACPCCCCCCCCSPRRAASCLHASRASSSSAQQPESTWQQQQQQQQAGGAGVSAGAAAASLCCAAARAMLKFAIERYNMLSDAP
jgi:hypothetical protein